MAETPKSNHLPSRIPSAGERRLSILLLAILALIAGVMLFVQGRFNPGAWREQAQTANTGRPPLRQNDAAVADDMDIAAGLVALSSSEQYGSDTLSDKIDGKADLYLSAGFKSLESMRFALSGDSSSWMERYVYDMGSLANAYAVFSAQRRQNIQPVDLAAHAYLAGNGLFFVHGPFYVEIIASQASQEVQNGLHALAEAFIGSHDVQTAELVELQLLPSDHRIADSVKLSARSAFGIEGLDGIFTAAYAMDETQALAFVSRRPSGAEAQALADKFQAFWIDFGGEAILPPDDLKSARIALILDNYEIALAQGDYLIGVHEATALEFGLALVKELQSRIAGIEK